MWQAMCRSRLALAGLEWRCDGVFDHTVAAESHHDPAESIRPTSEMGDGLAGGAGRNGAVIWRSFAPAVDPMGKARRAYEKGSWDTGGQQASQRLRGGKEDVEVLGIYGLS